MLWPESQEGEIRAAEWDPLHRSAVVGLHSRRFADRHRQGGQRKYSQSGEFDVKTAEMPHHVAGWVPI